MNLSSGDPYVLKHNQMSITISTLKTRVRYWGMLTSTVSVTPYVSTGFGCIYIK